MTWLTWRQFRAQGIVASAALALLAITLVITGVRLMSTFDAVVIHCHAHGDCIDAGSDFLGQDKVLQDLIQLLMFLLPGVIGVFWGAPLIARELETGTHRLAWTQSVTRGRWLAVKLGLAGLASVASAGLLSLMVTWWSSPFQRVALTRLLPGWFNQGGIVPMGYAALAFALAVTAGMLIRRTLPAVAVTLAIFVVLQVAVPLWVRPHLIAPLRAVSVLDQPIPDLGHNEFGFQSVGAPTGPGDWIISVRLTTLSPVFGTERAGCGKDAAYEQCMHLRVVEVYQPASRYWAFQWRETGIYLALAVALAGFCFWWVRRRLS